MSTVSYNTTDDFAANSTLLHSSATYQQELAITAAIAILGVWSTIGNIITILAISKTRKMRTKTNVFLLSLAVSDLISGAIASPLWLYRRTWGFSDWELSQFACKFYWGTDETTSYCTALHVASFAIWRFMLIRWPHKTGGIKKRTILIWISVIWVIAMIFGGFVYSTFFESIKKVQDGGVYSKWPMCSIDFRNDGVTRFKTYYTFSSTTFLMVPMAILFLVSILIAKELLLNKTFKSEIRKQKEKRAVAQLAMIATSFIVGYLPMTTYITWTTRAVKKTRQLDFWLGISVYLSLRFSECMNPIAYNVASSRMRQASKEVILSIWCCRKAKTALSSTSRSPKTSRSTNKDIGHQSSSFYTAEQQNA